MADESCGSPKPVGTAPGQPGAHTVTCVKFGRKMEGLDRAPWKGELGQRIYETVCADCWNDWLRNYSIKVINELRLDLSTERGQEEYDRYMREYLGLE